MTILVAVLLFVGRPERLNRFDVLERNTVLDECPVANRKGLR